MCVRELGPCACAALDKEPGPPARRLLATRAWPVVATVPRGWQGCHLPRCASSFRRGHTHGLGSWVVSPPLSALSASLCSWGGFSKENPRMPPCLAAFSFPCFLCDCSAATLAATFSRGGHGEPNPTRPGLGWGSALQVLGRAPCPDRGRRFEPLLKPGFAEPPCWGRAQLCSAHLGRWPCPARACGAPPPRCLLARLALQSPAGVSAAPSRGTAARCYPQKRLSAQAPPSSVSSGVNSVPGSVSITCGVPPVPYRDPTPGGGRVEARDREVADGGSFPC